MTQIPRLEPLEDRIVLDGADPEVTITGPDAQVFLGDQDVLYTLTFDNVGTESGYAPYIDLVIPSSGADGEGDGPSFDEASFLGQTIQSESVVFDSAGKAEHPFLTNPDGTPLIVTGGTPGDTLVTLKLPYGSFSPGNPEVEIDVTIDFSDQADLGATPTFTAVGGFELGEDPLDNPSTDAPIRGTPVTFAENPQLFTVSKSSTAPDSEAATGPSYPYQYTINVDVADGQTLTNFVITDNLPPEMVFQGNVTISGGTNPVITTQPTVGAQVQPGETLVVALDEVTGPVTVTFDYYLSNDPSDSASPTNSATTGQPTPVINQVDVQGDWVPLDPDDPATVATGSTTNATEARSLSVQKSAVLSNDRNVTGPTPFDEYTFTLDIQVSDYFTIGDLTVEDVLGDGWEYLPGQATFFVVEEDGTLGSSATPLSLTGVETVSVNDPATGSTKVTWDLSQAMQNAGGDGLLTGDIARDGSSSGTQTTVRIVYKAEIRDAYDGLPGGDPNISQGDRLVNTAQVTGDVRANATDGGDPTVSTGNAITDDAEVSVDIRRGEISAKSIYAVAGDTTVAPDRLVAAGDTVTFAVTYSTPLSAIEDFKIVDNLPQLVFDVSSEFNPATTWIASPTDRTAPPSVGTAYFGPNTTPALLGLTPTVVVDGPNNGLTFDFGTFTAAVPEDAVVEILFTTTVQDVEIAPQIFLTNQATAFETNSFGEEVFTTAIAGFDYGEPELLISKGVVATDSNTPGAALTESSGLSGVTAGDTGVPRFTGTVSSGALDEAAPEVNADIENIDAGDTLTFAVVLENEGASTRGAFNVTVTDTLPAGFAVPPGGLNLSVTDGAGNAIAFTRPDGTAATAADLFAGGIMLADDSPTQGALSAFNETSGENIVVITYDLVVEDSVTPGTTLTNTAAITSYNAYEGNGLPFDGAAPLNRVTGALEDDASASTATPTITKTLSGREFDGDISGRSAGEVAVGEEVEFRVRVDFTEGTTFNTVISDQVNLGGLTLLSATVDSIGAGLTSSTGVTVGDTAAIVGNGWSFDFGTLVNTGNNTLTDGSVEIVVTARASDADVGSAGHLMRNVATLDYQNAGGTSFSETDDDVSRIIEPKLTIDKSVSSTAVSAGESLTYQVVLDNGTGSYDAPAFDLVMEDTLPAEVTLDQGSITLLIDGVPTAFDGTTYQLITNVGGNANAFQVLIDRLDQGQTATVRYDADVITTLEAGAQIPNTAGVTYDSTPEDDASGPDLDDREYSATDSALAVGRNAEVSKTLLTGSTSYDDTSGSNLGIGELATFEMVVTIPEGTVDNVVLTDTLPAGFSYVSSEVVRIGDGPNDLISGAALAPGASGVNTGQQTVFTFGDLTNAVDSAQDSKDEIVVRVTARVTDVAQATDGASLSNLAVLTHDKADGSTATLQDTASATVVEPDMSIGKSVSPATADAGDTVSYTIVATNDGSGPAYDLRITDDVVGAEVVAGGPVTITLTDGAGNAYAFVEAPTSSIDGVTGALEVIVPDLPAGHVATITYDAVVQDGVKFSTAYTNTATVARYDSNPEGTATTPPVAPEVERSYAGGSATADVTTPDATLSKAVISTGNPDTADPAGGNNAKLSVGEEVTYELTITVPQGSADLVLTDALPSGLLAQTAQVMSIGDDVNDTSAKLAAGATNTSDTDISINADRDQVTFDFGTVSIDGADDAAATDTTITVRVTAIVADVAAAQDGLSLTNTATLAVTEPGGGVALQPAVTATETVDIVEPDVNVDKTGPVGLDPGDTGTYTVTLTNTGTAPAYDVTITDPFTNTSLTYETGTTAVTLDGVSISPTVVEPAPAGGGDGFQIQGLTLDPGEVIVVTFDATLSAAAPDAATFINTATVDYDSFDGSAVDADGTPLGRTGTDSDTHNVATVPRIIKTPIASQLPDTDSTSGSTPFELAIGEEVTYRYAITLPEIALDSVIATDTLPPGMEFVSVNVVAANGTGYAGGLTTTPDGVNPNKITFDFGAMTNASDGTIGPDDVLVFDVVARVTNDGTASAGDTLTNTVDLNVTPTSGTPFGTQTTSADVTVVEPLLTLDKTGPQALSPGGAAGTFTLTVVNTGVSGAEGPAYDLDISDSLPAGMVLDAGSFIFRDGAGVAITPETLSTTATSFVAEFPKLGVGETITVTYDASLAAGATPLTTFENTASADYFSAPDDLLDGGGSPVAKDYTPVTDTHLVSTVGTIEKTAIGSSLTETAEDGDSDGVRGLTIGESVTYELVLTLPEITMGSVALTDSLPAGLSFVGAEVTAIGSEITVGGGTDLTTINAGAGLSVTGQDMTLTLSDVVNTYVGGTIDAAQDTITVQITARVEDVPGNSAAAPNTQLVNTASLVVTPDGEPALSPVTDTETVEIIESSLTVTKNGNIAVNPGDEVTYQVQITNDGNAPAFDITVADGFTNPFLSLVSGTVEVARNGVDITADITVVETSTGFTFELVDTGTGTAIALDPGDTLMVGYKALLDANAPEAQSFVNLATVNYDSLPGDPVDSSGTPIDDRDYTAQDNHSVATVPYMTKVPTASNFTETDSTAGSDPFDLAIGEEVTFTYQLYLPEIDMAEVIFEDQLPAGLEFVSFNVDSFGSDMTDLSDNPLAAPTLTQITDQNFVLSFGGIRNNQDTAPPSIGADDIITLEVVARVTDDGAARAGDTLTNTATLAVNPVAAPPLDQAAASADVRIVEPALTVNKTGPVAVSPGTSGSYEITVINEGPGLTPNADGPAYDVVISDALPTGFSLTPGSIAVTLDGAPYTVPAGKLVSSPSGFSLTFDVLNPQAVVVIGYDATLAATATPLTVFDNTVSVDYDSAPGDPVAANGDPAEKTYDTETAVHRTATVAALDKSVLDTGFAETAADADGDGQTDLQIGETVTYELVITLPEYSMETVVLTDSLPAGLSFVSAEITELGSALTVDGSSDLATVATGASVVQSGQDLTVTLTNVVNSDSDGTGTRAKEAIVVQVVARVDDIAANVEDVELTNTAGVTVDPTGPDGPLTPVTDTETVEIVEPLLVLTKTGEIAGDAGQPVDYEITVVNDGKGSAFDVTISDALSDPSLSYDAGSAQVFLNGVLLVPQPTITTSGDGVSVVIDEISPGDSIRVEFSAIIAEDAPVGTVLPNEATVSYDSAPGTPVDGGGQPVGRDGSDQDSHGTASPPGLVKTPVASQFSATDSTAGSDPFELSIGEEVTFRYEMTLPELALDGVVLTDSLPAGLEFVSANVVSVAGTGASGGVVVTPNAGNPNLITFDFGAMINLSDGSIGADDVLTFDVVARVRSDGSADAGDALVNTAALVVDPAGDDPYGAVTDTAEVTVVEPLLTVDKFGPEGLNPGDTGTYVITITNPGDPGGAGPAFDVNVTDTLPQGMTFDPASLRFAIDGVAVVPAVLSTPAQGFDATVGVLPVGSTLTVTYSGTLTPEAPPLTSFVNTVTVGYDSVPGTVLDGSGTPVGVSYDPVSDRHAIGTGPTLTKTAVATEFAETPEDGDGDGIRGLAIGEEVTFELVLTLPEISMDTVTVTDTLPGGLSFVSAEVTRTGSEITIGGGTQITAQGQVVTLTLSDVVNAYVDGTIDPAQDSVTVTVTARTTDDQANTDGLVLTNIAALDVDPANSDPFDRVIAQDSVEIIEPSVTIQKTTTDIDPSQGETFVYKLVVTNDASATSPAFNTVVTDALPYELSLTGNTVLSDPSLGSVSSQSLAGATTLVVTIPVLEPGQSVEIDVEVFVGYLTEVLEGIENTARIDSRSTPIADDPDARGYIDTDRVSIIAQPVPDVDRDNTVSKAIDGIDDARFLPILMIDPIYTGSAEPGANVALSLYRQDGSLDYVRNVVADAGGHWIAIFPRVTLDPVEEDFSDIYARSVLFDAPVKTLDAPARDTLGYRMDPRALTVGAQLADEAYTLGMQVDRPATLPDEVSMHNARTYFAPAHIGEIYGNRDTLSVDEIFDNIAFRTIEEMYESSTDPLGGGLNRFNYEFMAAQTAVPGQQ